ncbi:biotin/lipoyl-binding protein [Alcanivorax sp. JB21]|uniref:carboxyl transferase domain-containing protein n=1 Tax=Alcanivorax limicola TaxID=2874102 RepID=UPI001CC00542|nr:carboxyl transferase domain-containing protein [Alcanivorax limicola]MBZ2188711.1 biotin/lipoyl-binding protein [Alcanivorax limicola]
MSATTDHHSRPPCLLIANRGEIAIRISRAAQALGWRTVAVYSTDDAQALHRRRADIAEPLPGQGPAAYLDIQALIEAARAQGCTAVHPGYGFLSESGDFARACEAAGLCFVGPTAAVLDTFGDKIAARRQAQAAGVPVVPGTDSATSLAQAQTFFTNLQQGQQQPQGMMIKALAGGGGRGMRAVMQADEIANAYARCAAEAQGAFGRDALYVEAMIPHARHIEVQILGDGQGAVLALGERECSLQRRHQKLVEVAPAPGLDPGLRQRMLDAAVQLGQSLHYRGLGTVEFLVPRGGLDFFFIETNPRLQVEHTVTEAVTGLDLVQLQLRVAQGASLSELALTEAPTPNGHAVQLRINMETLAADGSTRPAHGTLTAFEPPTGAGIRVDSCGYTGYTTNPRFDTLLAKLIVHAPQGDYAGLLRRAYHALCECRIEGVATGIPLLQNLLCHPQVQANDIDTGFIGAQLEALLAPPAQPHPRLYFSDSDASAAPSSTPSREVPLPDGCAAVAAPVSGTLTALLAAPGDVVTAGQTLALMDAMKMEFELKAAQAGRIVECHGQPGDLISEGQTVLVLDADLDATATGAADTRIDPDLIRDDLAEVLARQAGLLDAQRPDAVARRRKTSQRTARENIDALLDPGSFNEYGGLALAAQRRRRSTEELIAMSPADGLITGTGTINAGQFGTEASRCMALAYDYTVFAGTQGMMNHKKTDRALTLAEQWRLPVVLYAEGGGGRPGDTDFTGVAGLDNMTFLGLARLNGLVPLVSVVSGRCFAGNAALAGCCDVIIATENTTLGMAGPAMIEGGGLGRFSPEQVGPVSVQAANGVIDLVVPDEQAASAAARQYLGYFQGVSAEWDCADQRSLRHLIPENRVRVYDIRQVIHTLADTGSVMELRRHFAPGMITALVRIEGRPFGLMANNPMHLGGAIDSDGADKAARFMQLCDAFDLPLISLCDTPGFMVGPDAERTASVRHMSRLFVTAAGMTSPVFTVVLRKGYGLGAQAMAAGSFHAPVFTIAWPSGEFGAMGLEGAVRLGYARELAAIEDPAKRQKLFDKMVRAAYRQGKALNMASHLEIDNVIDPVHTRDWLLRGVQSTPTAGPRAQRKRFIDTW